MSPTRLLLLASCLSALAGAGAAQEAASPEAEAAAPASAPAPDAGIEEIVVTITKRDESLQEVPASISAFSPETLSLANIESAADLVTLIPNVVTKGESRTGNFSIRGVSESFSSQSPVAYHVNGIFKLDIDSLLGQYYDLESIQLVRGPSGTVYGRNATAGAIDLRWMEPHPGFELAGDALYGNYDHMQVRGLLNTPLLGAGDERLMARLVLQFDDRDGYMNDLADGTRDDDPHNAAELYSRLSLRSLPTDDLELNVRAFYNQSDADPYVMRPLVDEYTQGFLDTRQFDANGNLSAENFNVVQFDPYHGYTGFVGSLVDNLVSSNDPNIQQLEGLIRLGARVSGTPFRIYATDVMINGIPGLVPPIVDQFLEPPAQVGLAALPITSDPLEVRTSANLRHQTELRVYGADGSLAFDFSAGALGDLRLDFLFGYEHVHFDQVVDADGSELPVTDVFRPHRNNHYTGELRLSSDGDGSVDWIAGLFYFQHRTDRALDEIILPFGPIISELHGVSTGLAPFVSAVVRPLEWLAGEPKTDLELFGGWRWNRDETELEYENLAHPAGPSGLQRGDTTFTEDTWEVGLRWRPSESHMLYAKFAKGYKAGILEADNQTAEVRGVDPELIRAWEAGIRSTLWDGRAQLGLTGFWSSYTDLQVPQIVGLSQRTLNAAEATIRGVEVEAVVQPVAGLVVQASAGYLHAVFDDFCSDDAAQAAPSDPGCPAANPLFPWQGEQNLAGERLEDAPTWKTSWFARYEIDLGERGTLTPVVKLTWTDDYKLRPYGLPSDWVQSYTRTDVRLLWNSADDRFSVEAFCENLEDEVVYARVATTGEFNGSFPASLGLIPPRTYGLRIGYHWTAGES